MTRPTLNADQQQAVNSIAAFIVGPSKEFFLTGAPGVGKTFTTKELADTLLQTIKNYNAAMGKNENARKEIILTSTTNKAAAVLSEATERFASTIHSFLGVAPRKDFSTGQTLLTKNNKWRVHDNEIIFIDEASMIEQNLYNLIQEATDSSCKIIYIGDKNQLAPVMEQLSPAVRLADYPHLHYEITTPVRNAESPGLMDLCDRLRKDIVNETDRQSLTHWCEVPGEIEHVDGDQLRALVDQIYGPGGSVKSDDQELSCRILAYTNNTVIGYNDHIRNLRGLPSHPVGGEYLICNNHFSVGPSTSFSVEEELFVHNVLGPEMVKVDRDNYLGAYSLDVSSHSSTRTSVYVPESRLEYDRLLKHFKNNKQWRAFYKLQETFIDLRNREAATVYKAQGSTYDSVIMIMDDIFTSTDSNQLRRMLYVGASRAKKKVYVYDKGIHQNKRGIYL